MNSVCVPRQEHEVYQRYLANVNQLEDQFAALWTQCQRCQVLTRYVSLRC